jgi:hypothetical protein
MDKLVFGIGGITSIYMCNYAYKNKEIVGYKLIYLFSYGQILLQRFGFAKTKTMIENKPTEYCYFNAFDNVTVTELCELKDDLLCDNTAVNIIDKISNNKLLVYKDGINHICIYQPITNFVLTYEKSNITFIALTVKIDLVETNIKLSGPDFNFYIVNNVINKTFIKYYLTHILKTPISDDILDYSLVLVDENVQFTTLSIHDEILIEKDTYSIIFKNNTGTYFKNTQKLSDKNLQNNDLFELAISIEKCNINR